MKVLSIINTSLCFTAAILSWIGIWHASRFVVGMLWFLLGCMWLSKIVEG